MLSGATSLRTNQRASLTNSRFHRDLSSGEKHTIEKGLVWFVVAVKLSEERLFKREGKTDMKEGLQVMLV